MATKLTITNSTNEEVTLWLTLGDISGFVNDVFGIFGITEHGLQGSVTLDASQKVEYESQIPISGNVSFNIPPMNCPTDDFPNGVNIFEFCLNNWTQPVSAPQETIDISCVTGVNSLLLCSMSGGGDWNAGPTQQNVTIFKNKGLDENTGQVGVFPVACDDCTASVSPPQCPDPLPPATPQSEKICNVQRPAVEENCVGLVSLLYKGKI